MTLFRLFGETKEPDRFVIDNQQRPTEQVGKYGRNALVQQVYECMYIFDSNRYARDSAGVSKLATDLIEKHGGEVLVSRLWNEQRLAYPIKGNRKGTYWLAYFSMPGDNLKEFNRACEISEEVLRHLTLKIDPRLVDTLVSHARGESQSVQGEDTEASDADGGQEQEKTAVS